MKTSFHTVSSLVALILATTLILFQSQVEISHAAPALQLTAFPTPTPGADGRILYVVQSGDTLWRIAAVSGVTLDELRQLNNLGPEDIIREGETLLLGFGGPSEAEETPAPESGVPTPDAGNLPPTPTSGPGTGIVCIFLYDDQNGDAIRQEDEFGIADGAISLSNRDGSISITENTVVGLDEDEEPVRVCIEELITGDYNITVAIPEGYNPTTNLNYGLNLRSGDETYIDFGAQVNSKTIVASPSTPEEGGRSPTLGIIGGSLIAAGLLLAILAGISTRRRFRIQT